MEYLANTIQLKHVIKTQQVGTMSFNTQLHLDVKCRYRHATWFFCSTFFTSSFSTRVNNFQYIRMVGMYGKHIFTRFLLGVSISRICLVFINGTTVHLWPLVVRQPRAELRYETTKWDMAMPCTGFSWFTHCLKSHGVSKVGPKVCEIVSWDSVFVTSEKNSPVTRFSLSLTMTFSSETLPSSSRFLNSR